MVDDVMVRFKVRVTQGQCYGARKQVLGEVEGALLEHYSKLWDYAMELKRSNPGSIVMMAVERPLSNQQAYFQRYYICLDALKKGWLNGCRKFIGLDGCFLKSMCKGQLLSAVGRDGNNHIFPIAWAVVEVESTESWSWFISLLLEDRGYRGGRGWTVMSDEQKGLDIALKNLMPNVERRQCARHIYANFRKKFSGVHMRNLFWQASKATTIEEFDSVMSEIRLESKDAFDHLMTKDPKTWSRAFFSVDTCCENVENNISECFNAYIRSARRKPIITMLEEIRVQLMERMRKMRNMVRKQQDNMMPSIRKKMEKNKDNHRFWRITHNGNKMFEAKQGLDGYVVDLRNWTCTCRSWQLSGIPCPHSIGAIYAINDKPDNYISTWYIKETFEKTYHEVIQPVNGVKLWPKTPYEAVLPPVARRLPGRPTIARRREEGEKQKSNRYANAIPRTGIRMTCQNCYEVGHNKRACKNQKRDPPLKVPNKRGRPQK